MEETALVETDIGVELGLGGLRVLSGQEEGLSAHVGKAASEEVLLAVGEEIKEAGEHVGHHNRRRGAVEIGRLDVLDVAWSWRALERLGQCEVVVHGAQLGVGHEDAVALPATLGDVMDRFVFQAGLPDTLGGKQAAGNFFAAVGLSRPVSRAVFGEERIPTLFCGDGGGGADTHHLVERDDAPGNVADAKGEGETDVSHNPIVAG